MSNYLAFDLGAESGRAVLASLNDGRVAMREIHRFANRPVRLGETLYWDFPFLFAEILAGLKIAGQLDVELDGIGVDTWGVDFGLLGPDDRLLSNPVHYRDGRTENIHAYSDPTMSAEAVFQHSCCEPWAISSLFQLIAMQRQDSPILPLARTFLHMPDLINYFLTGIKRSERSIVSTGNLLDAKGGWSRPVIEAFRLPEMFAELVEPGTVLGPMTESVRQQTGLGEVPVVASLGHDTAAVVAAVPAVGANWAFLSCGTWSILGTLVDTPILSSRAFEKNFCNNEYTLGGWFINKNILGLWLVQELRRKWDAAQDPWDYDRLTAEAAGAQSSGLVDCLDPSLLAPPDMEEALYSLLARLGQPKPQSRGQLVRCVLESLALDYACRLETLSELTGRTYDTLQMVGGGIKNTLLCQLTANACRIPVHAGADQCTSLGNALTVAVGLGDLAGPEQVRQVMHDSFAMTVYEPQDDAYWQERCQQYK
ncbi:MAG: hypothetical protein JW810_14410, partial [Sedimentisphaerales bacterium]|nr:hypothetical protein [Sedimentisphaerales bacterium]